MIIEEKVRVDIQLEDEDMLAFKNAALKLLDIGGNLLPNRNVYIENDYGDKISYKEMETALIVVKLLGFNSKIYIA